MSSTWVQRLPRSLHAGAAHHTARCATATIPAAMRAFPYRPPTPAEAVENERGRYVAFVEHLSSADLADIEPLRFQHQLSTEASKRTWDALDRRWGTGGGRPWYPLTGPEIASSEVLALQEAWFRAAIPDETLRVLLSRRGIARVWELTEFGGVLEIDVALLVVTYTIQMDDDRGEKYWTAVEMDWLIYASHESSITVAGAWLIAAIKEIWPRWHEHGYTGWDYVRPPIVRYW